MNRIYRLVWNLALGALVAVAENAKGRGKSGSARKLIAGTLALAGSAFLVPSALAAPIGGQVSAGAGSIAQAGSTTTITQSSQNLAINWQSFNIAANEAVRFNQPDTMAIALNRVLGQDPSQIFGSLSANGQVFVLNPNGVLFGSSAQVNVGGLVVSTLSISDVDFMAGKHSFSGTTGSVVNQGTLTAAQNGYIALLAPEVRNEGVISATLGTALLAAGDKVTLTLNNGSLLAYSIDQGSLKALADNKQLIQADGGQVLMSAMAANSLATAVVNNTGIIEARTIQNHNGTIKLMGDMQVGTVNVGGMLDASAPNGGNGGFIETSAASVKIADDAKVTTAAATGLYGTWLIDPKDFTVSATGDLTGADLSSMMLSTNLVILSSGGGTAGSGNINVNDAVSWTANNTLYLTASNNVNINANITATGNTAGLLINPNTANNSGFGIEAASGTGTFNLKSGASITLSGTNPSLSIAGNSYTVINSLGAPYSTTTTDLQGINGNRAGYYALGSNIDATATSGWNSGAGFIPIGGWYTGEKFTGTFDGLGHTICNLNVNWGTIYIGLFGYADRGSVIQNVGLIGANIIGNGDVGALAGYNGGSIRNSYASGSVTGNGSSIGGLVGENAGATLDNSYAAVTVSGSGNVGGLVGNNNTATISCTSGINCHSGSEIVGSMVNNSYATGTVSDPSGSGNLGGLAGNNAGSIIQDSFATGSVTATDPNHLYAGGLVGYNDGTAAITNSHATGNVTAYYSVGGLLGLNYGSIDNSYATGIVSGVQFVGGLSGYNSNGYSVGTINNSYATGAVSGHHGVGGLVGESSGGTISTSYATGSVTGTADSGSGLTGDRIGGLVGSNFTDISNSYATGSVTGEYDVGGLIGLNFNALTNSGATGNVSGSAEVGGLAGTSYGSISNSFATGSVTGGVSSLDIGGLIGRIWGSTISTSFASGSVTGGAGSSNLGGLVGLNFLGTIISGSWNTDLIAAGVGSGAVGGATGLVTGTMPTASLFANFHFTTTPGVPGNNWVVVDTDGTLNNAGGAVSATLPMLASEYSTTIKGAHQLQLMQMALGASYTLGANIAALNTGNSTDIWGSSGFVRVGSYATPFSGTFDGLGHIVNDLVINSPLEYGGLFGRTANGSTIRNVGMVGGSISGDGSANEGALVGHNLGTVSNSYASGTVITGAYNGGGLAGVNEGAGAIISNSYASGVSVTGVNAIGGLVGLNWGTVSNSWASGQLSAPTIPGGLVGANVNSVSNSYWDSGINAIGIGGGTTAGATGLASLNMKQQSNFASWDFTNTWVMYEGHTAPLLRSFMTPLTVTAANGTKTYDGQVFTESVSYCCTPGGTLPSGMGSVSYTAGLSYSFGVTNAGSYTIAPGGLYSNQQGYLISYVNGSLTINKAPLTISTLDVTKTYSGTLDALGTATVTSGTLYHNASNSGTLDSISGGTFAFTDKNVGSNNKTVTASGVTVTDGNSGGNYNVSYADNTHSTINPADLSLSGTQVYTGTTVFAGSNLTATGINGETFGMGGAGASGNLSTRNVQSNQPLASVAGLTLGSSGNGGLAGNYNSLATTGSSVSVTPAPITVSINDVVKPYDGGTSAAGTLTIPSGLLLGDALGYTGFAFIGKDVGIGNKTVTVTGLQMLDGNGGQNHTLTLVNNTTSTINKVDLTLSGTQVYNGTTVFAGSNLTATGVNGETFAITGTGGTGNLSTKNVQSNQALANLSGLTLGGGNTGAALATNYNSLATSNSSVSVTPKTVTATGLTANDKVYNANDVAILNTGSATLTGGATTDVDNKFYTSDLLTLNTTSATGVFTTSVFTQGKDVGTGKAVTVSGLTLGNDSAGNYTLIQQTGLTADITAKALVASGLTGINKVYNTTLLAGLSGMAVVANGALTDGDGKYYSADTVNVTGTPAGTFADKNVGTAKSVAITGLGVDNTNYTVSHANTSANITAKALVASGLSGINKVYNTTLLAGLSSTAVVANGATTDGDGKYYTADTVNVTGTPAGAFADKNVGTAKSVAITGLGVDNTNYTVSHANTSADITTKAITATGITANNKVYNANDVAILNTGSAAIASGATTDADNKFYTADAITLNVSSATGVFTLGKDVGTAKAVTVSGLALGNNAAGNYTLLQPSGMTADINKANAVVTANSGNVPYTGLPQSVSGFSATGLVNGENASVLSGVSASGSGTNAGSYTVVAAGSDSNYNLTLNNGTLAINPDTLTVTADPVSRLYGAANPAFSGSVTGFVLTDTLANATTGTETFSSTAITTSNVGSHDITGAGLTANHGNYVFAQAAGNASALTIVQPADAIADITQAAGGILPAVAQAITALPEGANLLPAFSAGVAAAVTPLDVITPPATLSNLQYVYVTTATPGNQSGNIAIADNSVAAPTNDQGKAQSDGFNAQLHENAIQFTGTVLIKNGGINSPTELMVFPHSEK